MGLRPIWVVPRRASAFRPSDGMKGFFYFIRPANG
ncbi:hypothetical protein CLOLEP_02146 [[Clostridium] leptum DSM 753]|uniref:Uncharacterized protein n=1 Tax=[Clostridium] leptum DSM 753 TaxID=428125 RepID=A7VUA0_9FIRM|nr:hypothetical protein CLOLEP_02146 [[Clostridium] leptum DSM 753]